MTPGPHSRRTEPEAARRLAVLHADAAATQRIEAALRSAGAPVEVQALDGIPDPERAPDVLIVWSGRGITARDALVTRLHHTLPATRIVVIGPADAPSSVRAAIEAGANGFVFATEIETALVPTIAAAVAGQVAVPAGQRRQLGVPNLTAREKQILGMVVLGLSNKEIGSQLYLAESTVKSHLSSVFNKLGVRSRNEAVALILDPEQKLGLGILGISSNAGLAVKVAT